MRQSRMNLPESEKPIIETAVKKTLKAVIFPVPNFLIRRSDIRADVIVAMKIMEVIMLALESGAFISTCITGQPEPRRESGRPRLTKAMYIIAISKDISFTARRNYSPLLIILLCDYITAKNT